MATASVTHTFVDGQTNDAARVNTNFADLVTFLNGSVIHKDASVAFTAIPSGPASDPTSSNQLTRKGYVDLLNVGKLSLTGGTMTGNLTISNATPYVIFDDTDVTPSYRSGLSGDSWLLARSALGTFADTQNAITVDPTNGYRFYDMAGNITASILPTGWVNFGSNSTPPRPLQAAGAVVGGSVAFLRNTDTSSGSSKGLAIQVDSTTHTTSNDFLLFLNNAGTKIGGVNWATATTVAYTTSSDKRLKDHVSDYTEGLSVIELLEPVRFKWKADGHEDVGFYAQDVAQIVDGVAFEGDDESGTPWGMDHSKLVVHLVSAVKELASRLEALENAD